MATVQVQATPNAVPTQASPHSTPVLWGRTHQIPATRPQARSARATTVSPPPSSGLTHSRPWRSSPLAGPVFSTLPPAIPESVEELQEDDPDWPDSARTRSPSLVSQTGSLSASGYGSRNASSSASALALAEGEESTSSVSLSPSTTLAHGTSSSQGHGSSQSHSHRPSRLSKSWSHRMSLPADDFGSSLSDSSTRPPPRARTLSHGRSRPKSFPSMPLAPPPMTRSYSQTTSLPDSEANTAKQPPSKSRDPASNWMSSSPFGPAQTPKFSRLAMASPAVVMPLSAKEYRKQKARESMGKGKEKEKAPSTSSNRVAFIDNALSAFPGSNGVPMVKVSPPPSEGIHQAPTSSDDHTPGDRSQPQSQADHPPSKLLPQTAMTPPPSSSKLKRPRSRPHTPPRSSPLAAHPPISPKSSSGTFYSAASGSEDDTLPHPRPRPRRRRKSYPDRVSNGHRLSLLEAMNRLSQEASQHRLSGHSQTDEVNRLSMMSQASGHTLFYDVGESEGDKGQVTSEHGKGNGHADGDGRHTPLQHTQSLENLGSALARTGIEVVRASGGDVLSEDERKAKRNVRTVRISDTVEVSPPPVTRRRKLTKSRRGSTSGPASASRSEPVKEAKAQTQERRVSLLPWRSKGPSESKVIVAGAGSGPNSTEKDDSTTTKGFAHHDGATTIPQPLSSLANGSAHVKSQSQPTSNNTSSKRASGAPAAASNPELGTFPPRKTRRYTFSFIPSTTFYRPKREKSHTAPASVGPSLEQTTQSKARGSVIVIERSGTDSTSTSIRTITQGSQSTLVPTSPGLHDVTTPVASGNPSGRGTKSSVPMLRRLNAQEMATTGLPSSSEWEGRGDSTPSLITNGSTTTSSSSSPRTPSYNRTGGEVFVPRPSGLKESFTDTSEDSEGTSGGERVSKTCMHRRHEPSPLSRAGVGWGEMSDEDERRLRREASPRHGSRPGTSSSSVTTATEASGSYLSFSTVPASTASSSASTSRSESPSPGSDKRERRVSMVKGGDEDLYTCALCGHQSVTPLPSRSLSPAPTYDPELEGVHPMFAIPLITVPAPVLSPYPRSSPHAPSAVPRYAKGRKRERRTSASVPPTTATAVPANVSVNVPLARPDPYLHHVDVHAIANGAPVVMSTKVMNDGTITTTTTTALPPSPAPSPVPPPQKMRKRNRPQTAPAGTGDAALRFIEDAKAMRAREGGVDLDVLIGGDRLTKPKAGSGESKLKTVLKGLLRWGG